MPLLCVRSPTSPCHGRAFLAQQGNWGYISDFAPVLPLVSHFEHTPYARRLCPLRGLEHDVIQKPEVYSILGFQRWAERCQRVKMSRSLNIDFEICERENRRLNA